MPSYAKLTSMLPFHSFLEDPLSKSSLSRIEFAEHVYRQRNLPPEAREKDPTKVHWRRRYPYQPVGYYMGNVQRVGQKQSLWVPHPLEVRPCCWAITPPGNWTHGWHRHCRTIIHVATLMNVDERELRARVTKPRERCSMGDCGRFARKGKNFCERCAFVHRLDSPEPPC